MAPVERTASRIDIRKCGFAIYPPGLTGAAHLENEHGLLWMDEGTGRVEIEGQSVTLTTHDIAVYPAGARIVFYWTDQSVRMGHVYFVAPPGFRRELSYHLRRDDVIPPLLKHLLWLQLERPDGWIDSLQTVLLYVLQMLETGDSRTDLDERPPLPPIIERAVSLVRERWTDGPFRSPTLRELARNAAVSPEHLSRMFTQHLGFPPLLALRIVRLHRASAMLRQTDSPIRSISAECGFTTEFQFSAAFKRWAAVPPSAYRAGKGAEMMLPVELEPLSRQLRGYLSERRFTHDFQEMTSVDYAVR